MPEINKKNPRCQHRNINEGEILDFCKEIKYLMPE